jgi:hypothetical protein
MCYSWSGAQPGTDGTRVPSRRRPPQGVGTGHVELSGNVEVTGHERTEHAGGRSSARDEEGDVDEIDPFASARALAAEPEPHGEYVAQVSQG